MSTSPTALVEGFLTGHLEFPPASFWVSHLADLDSAQHQIVVASPKNMSRGGDLPFVVHGDTVVAGSRKSLEEIVRREGLAAGETLAVTRFLRLFLLLAVPGAGSLDGDPVVSSTDAGFLVVASVLDGHTGRKRSYRITVSRSGALQWQED
jgi:hypothetical protein